MTRAVTVDDGGLLPWRFVKLQACRLFGCLPSQLDEEDASETLQMLRLQSLADQLIGETNEIE